MIVAEFDAKQVDGFLSRMATAPLQKVQMMAVNKAAKMGRTEASRQIRRKWNLPAKVINDRLRLEMKATSNSGAALLRIQSRPVSLTYFGAIWYRGSRRTTRKKSTMGHKNKSGKSGVYVKILKNAAPTHLPNSFIAYGRKGGGGTHDGVAELGTSGHIAVFRRKGKAGNQVWRHPLFSQKDITVPSMFQQKEVYDPTIDFIGKIYTKEFYRLLSL